MATERFTFIGSSRPLSLGHTSTAFDPAAQVVVTLELRRSHELPRARPFHALSVEQLAAQHGAFIDDFDRVNDFAIAYGLAVITQNQARRTVQLSGTAAQMEAAFGVRFVLATGSEGSYRHYSGNVSIPTELQGVVLAVLGLSQARQAEPHYRKASAPRDATFASAAAFATTDIAELYRFPPGTGAGETIALIELGGGVGSADLSAYFSALGIPTPSVTTIGVGGASSSPGTDVKADTEVMLDVEVAGVVAPQAAQRVYFGKNSDEGFIAAVQEAVYAKPPPTVISISWGMAESAWTTMAMETMNRVFQDAASLGIPVCVASGDNGSTDDTNALAVDFPASAPYALGCGGTSLEADGSQITSETVWNDADGATGGGYSSTFPKPSYQTIAGTSRGVPDVAANADPQTGYSIRYDGREETVGGTSAVAPLWAGLIARLAQNLGHPTGFLNSVIYLSQLKSSFHDIVEGNNDPGNGGGKYDAGPGWDPCTGLGSPDGTTLLAALRSLTPAPIAPPPGTGSSEPVPTGSGAIQTLLPTPPSPAYAYTPTDTVPVERTQYAASSSQTLGVVAAVGLVVAGIVGIVGLSGDGERR